MASFVGGFGSYAAPVVAAAEAAYTWWQGGPIPKEPIEELAISVTKSYKDVMPTLSKQLANLGAARPFISVAAKLNVSVDFKEIAVEARKNHQLANDLIVKMYSAIRKADTITTGQVFAQADIKGESVESGLARVALIRNYIAKITNDLTQVNNQLLTYIGKFEKELSAPSASIEGDESKVTEDSFDAATLSTKLLEIPSDVEEALKMFQKSVKPE